MNFLIILACRELLVSLDFQIELYASARPVTRRDLIKGYMYL